MGPHLSFYQYTIFIILLLTKGILQFMVNEYPTPGERFLLPPNYLKERIAAGANVHQAIGATLREDARLLYIYHRGYLLSQTRGGAPPRLPERVVSLYGLSPSGPDAFPDFNLANNLAFIGGFSYVGSHLFPTLETAVQPPSTARRTRGSQEEAVLSLLSPEERQMVLKTLDLHTLMRDFTVELVRVMLERDPTGVEWLERKVWQEFEGDTLEFMGAQRAIKGTRKLLSMLGKPG